MAVELSSRNQLLQQTVQDVLGLCRGLCLDNAQERQIVAVALIRNIAIGVLAEGVELEAGEVTGEDVALKNGV